MKASSLFWALNVLGNCRWAKAGSGPAGASWQQLNPIFSGTYSRASVKVNRGLQLSTTPENFIDFPIYS